jgi:UDP-glucuronate 4-epimerase
MHVAEALLKIGEYVLGIDSLNDYYDVGIKHARLRMLQEYKNFTFIGCDITNKLHLEEIFKKNNISKVVHLAAQPGVRYSIENPSIYIQTNICGFFNILECVRNSKVNHLLYASSSSVYGANIKLPFSVRDKTDSPVSLYAATKKSNELMAHAYSTLYGFKTTGLRFFTVYGPWGRPDMAPWLFTDSIKKGKKINIFNAGKMRRDYTYIEDAVTGLITALYKDNQSDNKYNIYNIGNQKQVELLDFIQVLEKKLQIEAIKNFMPMQQGDVVETYADMSETTERLNFEGIYTLERGVGLWVDWFNSYKNNSQ